MRPGATRVSERIYKRERVPLALVFDLRLDWVVKVRVHDVDDATSEKSLLELIHAAQYGHRGVTSHARLAPRPASAGASWGVDTWIAGMRTAGSVSATGAANRTALK